ncbi:outer spore coat protein CotE [Paenalkalicoccus suaedae]|uniref:Outer spore coat protein CotE n=1 Tax=Paenalkalicoccus suaedae TaxID=2592382 RepID=A0A859FER7_9BACI|nr:outer spore coat protein CotE [Paenalkalicoccus suaedae]QKS71360.1 outer spore coat protein CotE [Paenalkalicoccus suaedae]
MYREIITKAICGKGTSFQETFDRIQPEETPTNILGCWIINHRFQTTLDGQDVEISGTYDINLWYSTEDDTKTKVATETIEYKEPIVLKMSDGDILSDMEIVAREIQQPQTLEAKILADKKTVQVHVQKEMGIEAVAETKLLVKVKESAEVEEVEYEEQEETDHSFPSDEDFASLHADFLEEEAKN